MSRPSSAAATTPDAVSSHPEAGMPLTSSSESAGSADAEVEAKLEIEVEVELVAAGVAVNGDALESVREVVESGIEVMAPLERVEIETCASLTGAPTSTRRTRAVAI